MMYAKGAIKPVQQMSEEAGNPIDPKEFIGAVAGYYSSADGKLVSMPFNSSTVVFYYNKDAFKKAGLDADKPPKTWEELAAAGQKLGRRPGMRLHHLVAVLGPAGTFSAWHNVPYATKDNGFGGLDARVAVNTRCTCATWKTWPSWARKASSCTAVAATSRTRCSSAASAP